MQKRTSFDKGHSHTYDPTEGGVTSTDKEHNHTYDLGDTHTSTDKGHNHQIDTMVGGVDMPVTAKVIKGKWRVVEVDTGQVATNKKGTAVDGGGHESKTKAQKQAAAINIYLHKKGKV